MHSPKRQLAIMLWFSLALAAPVFAADHLQLNPKLDYSSDSQDGPLITGDNMGQGVVAGKPNYIIFFQEGCFNSKRQARTTVELYHKYKDRVNFVIVDLDRNPTTEQQELAHRFYRNYIPHVTIIDAAGATIYDQAGEIESSRVSGFFEQAFHK